MGKMKLGIQMWSIYDVVMNMGPARAIELISEMGYTGFEFLLGECATFEEKTGVKPAEFKRILRANGVSILGTHISMDAIKTVPEKVIRDCAEYEIPYAAIGPAFYGDRMPFKEQKETYEECGKAAHFFKEHGVQFQVHCAVYGYLKDYKGRYCSEGMLEDIGLEYIQPEFDTAWNVCGGTDPVEMIRKYKGYVDVVHAKDFHPPMENTDYILVRHDTVFARGVGCAFGDNGIVDAEGVVKAAAESGTKWMVTELWNEPNALENAKTSADNLIALMKKYDAYNG